MLSTSSVERHAPVYFDASVFEAAKQGNIAKIQEFIEQRRGWIDAPNAKGNSILYVAAKNGRAGVVHCLMRHGASLYPNLRGKLLSKMTPPIITKFLRYAGSYRVSSPGHIVNKKMLSLQFNEIEPFISSLQPELWRMLASNIYLSCKKDTDAAPSSLPAFQIILKKLHKPEERSATINNFLYVHLYCFSTENLIKFIHSLPENDQTTANSTIVATALSIGDINLAKWALARMDPTDSMHRLCSLQIQYASDYFTILHQYTTDHPKEFELEISSTFGSLGAPHGLANEVIAQGSFSNVLDYVNNITLIRKRSILFCLRLCPSLQQAQHTVLADATARLKQEIHDFSEIMRMHYENIAKTKDDQQTIAFIDDLDPKYTPYACAFIERLCIDMCRSGLYQQVYNLLSKECQKFPLSLRIKTLSFIIELINAKDLDWRQHFFALYLSLNWL